MIKVNLSHVKTLEDFNTEIIKKQEIVYGKGYCDIHNAIVKYLAKNDVYMELGVNQGGTASTALLCKPQKVVLLDINLNNYREYLSDIAQSFSSKNNITLETIETSSLSKNSTRECDLLVIDSVHTYNHITKELEIHSRYVKKYIIAHDTTVVNRVKDDVLFIALTNFCSNNSKWKIIERNENNVGYTVLGKNK